MSAARTPPISVRSVQLQPMERMYQRTATLEENYNNFAAVLGEMAKMRAARAKLADAEAARGGNAAAVAAAGSSVARGGKGGGAVSYFNGEVIGDHAFGAGVKPDHPVRQMTARDLHLVARRPRFCLPLLAMTQKGWMGPPPLAAGCWLLAVGSVAGWTLIAAKPHPVCVATYGVAGQEVLRRRHGRRLPEDPAPPPRRVGVQGNGWLPFLAHAPTARSRARGRPEAPESPYRH